ncbi:MAG: hypothetical protein WA421_11780 [Nitrososphaeraceae archaeon]
MTRKYRKRPPEPEIPPDREVKILVNRCDICNTELPETAASESLAYRMDVLAEMNNSFESVHDKSEPKLLLCTRCSEEYMIPSYS